ncbi:Dipeptidase [Tangfeifania diversioriginum]|uniref:Dipeptidase n=1 Tax=Tangfeifania diversioriginum TaxID=1168035 RepID=A0A1M6G4D9_9BACT|nr:C69 family dipeptidase [Tangfeifania diversioriginum]SHJ04783.1 Dipeptidase [Tangfeifania diversioriginum]
MKRHIRISLILGILAIITNPQVNACTNFLVTAGATVDGSTMISYAADSHIRYGELYFSKAQHWPEGSMVTIYDRSTAEPLGQIPQVPYTYQTVGFMNEHQLAIGESTFGGRSELVDSTGLMDYAALMFMATQRAKTAREAIKVIAELIEKHGYASSGESFSIGDPNEVWIMELIGKGTDLQHDEETGQPINQNKGAVWVAIRIPDGYVSAHANHARITTFPKEDNKRSISSKNLDDIFNPEVEVVYAHDVISFARAQKYFDGKDAEFSFSDVYAPLDFGAARFCELRVWSMFSQVSDEMDEYWDYATGEDLEAERMPLFIKPNRKLTPQDLMSFKRNHLQGTELDMAKDAGAGPFGRPYRWRGLTWEYNGQEYFNERTTVTQQTGFSFIAQMRSWLPDPIGGINWFGVDDAGTTVYVPFYCGINRVPENWAEGYGDILDYKDDAAFWVFNRVAHYAYLFYNRVMPDVREVQSELENKFTEYTPGVDAAALKLWETDKQLAREFLTDYSVNMGEYTVKRWKDLGDFLLVKYLDGNRKQEENGRFLRNEWGYPQPPSFPGYSDEWKENVIKDTGERFVYPDEE